MDVPWRALKENPFLGMMSAAMGSKLIPIAGLAGSQDRLKDKQSSRS
jgi:hypothetical protein